MVLQNYVSPLLGYFPMMSYSFFYQILSTLEAIDIAVDVYWNQRSPFERVPVNQRIDEIAESSI